MNTTPEQTLWKVNTPFPTPAAQLRGTGYQFLWISLTNKHQQQRPTNLAPPTPVPTIRGHSPRQGTEPRASRGQPKFPQTALSCPRPGCRSGTLPIDPGRACRQRPVAADAGQHQAGDGAWAVQSVPWSGSGVVWWHTGLAALVPGLFLTCTSVTSELCSVACSRREGLLTSTRCARYMYLSKTRV